MIQLSVPIGLTKSQIAEYEQCPKRLWLSAHRPEASELDAGASARFRTGQEVGKIARAQLPTGILVDLRNDDRAEAVRVTSALIESSLGQPIFEAALEYDGVFVRIDILEPDGEAGWRLAEVKSSTKVKSHYVGDLATQVWVAQNAGMKIAGAAIRHINGGFVLEREAEWTGLFTDTDLASEIYPATSDRASVIASARLALDSDKPDVATGSHCDQPVMCPFVSHCHAAQPAGPEWPVTVLPNGGGKRWLARGIDDLFTIDPSDLTSQTHKRVYHATVDDIVYHDVEGARRAISCWAYPRTWLDFETITFAIPRWIGTRPYQQVPFQFSAHVETADGALAHHEFLSLDGSDPRRACAEALLVAVPPTGAVIAYFASFEKSRILELAAAFPDLAAPLHDIAERIVDLLPVARNNWYHRDQRGSWSIKAVLPTVASDLDYGRLEVKDGGMAQEAYAEAIHPSCSANRRMALDEALRIYCGRDTEAMIVLARRLCSAGED